MNKINMRPKVKTSAYLTPNGFTIEQSVPFSNNGRWKWDRQVVILNEKELLKVIKELKKENLIK